MSRSRVARRRAAMAGRGSAAATSARPREGAARETGLAPARTTPAPAPAAGAALGFGVTVAAIALVAGAKLISDSCFGNGFPPILFLCAVMVGAWYGGLRQGLLASALTTLVCAGLLVGTGNPHLLDLSADALRLGVFLLEGLVVSSLMESLHAARRRAEERRLVALEHEAVIRRKEQRLRAVQDSALDCIITLDSEGRILEANPMFEATFGQGVNAVRGRKFPELALAQGERDRFARLAAALTSLPDGAVERRIETTALRHNGAEFPAELVLAIIRLEEPPLFTACLRDITQRKRAEETLRESHASFERRVRQQTAALERVTADLLADIAQRQKCEAALREQIGQLRRQLGRATAVRRIDAAATGFDLGSAFDVALGELQAELRADAAAVLLWDAGGGELREAAAAGFGTGRRPRRSLRADEGDAGRALTTRQTVGIPDRGTAPGADEYRAYHAAPLVARGQVLGVLEVYHRAPHTPDADWLDFLETAAAQLASAVDNAAVLGALRQSHDELARAYDSTIEGWAHALDLRDREPDGHCRRVTALTMKLARLMGLPEDEVAHIRRGALLHDVGKTGIPDSILFKSGPLDESEMAVVQRHPALAFEILAPIHFLAPAIDIPYCHHEKWDGTGYPRGLSGEQIPLAARIFALVDIWDALTSDRPFRRAWSKQRALAHIRSLAGTHLDPRVVELFLRSMSPDDPAAAPGRAWVLNDRASNGTASGDCPAPSLADVLRPCAPHERMGIIIGAGDPAAVGPLVASLERLGHEVLLVDDVECAWSGLRGSRARIVITDWTLPGGGGGDLCRRIRRLPTSLYTYVIAVADQEGSALRLESLIAGADDFLTRPFDVRELVVRLENARRILAMQEELERENARLAEQALVDALTGLKNRRYFHQVLEDAFYRAMQLDQPLSLVMIDVDHFKRYNDQYGHPAGDDVLRTVAGVLRAGARDQDIVARYGGEEFVLLLPGTDAAGGRIASERLRAAVAAADGTRRPVTISIGISTLSKQTVSAAQLLANADLALYRSKQAGRNRVTHEEDLDEEDTQSAGAASHDAGLALPAVAVVAG